MSGAVEHAFFDQFGSHGPKARDLNTESVSNVSCAMSTWSKFSHRSEEILFTGCETVIAHTKEILIQTRNYRRGCALYNSQCDGAGRRQIPSLIAPLLKKIWIPFRQAINFA